VVRQWGGKGGGNASGPLETILPGKKGDDWREKEREKIQTVLPFREEVKGKKRETTTLAAGSDLTPTWKGKRGGGGGGGGGGVLSLKLSSGGKGRQENSFF